MLKVYSGDTAYPLSVDDYYIKELFSGLDELIFDISIWDENYKYLIEESAIVEGAGQRYLIKAVDAGQDTAKIKAQLDVDDFRASMYIPYTNSSATVSATIQAVLPAGWQLVDQSAKTMLRTIEIDYATPFDVVEACRETYGIAVRYDNIARKITLIDPESYQPNGAIIARELNMTELNYKGKSSDFITRLYAYGADGLSFADINNGLPYVEDHTYSDKIISGYWEDNRYTVAENLLADAKKTLAQMAIPQRSYQCSVVDLAKTNPEMYGFENFNLFEVVTFIEPTQGLKMNYQVVEYWRYPNYPEKNTVTLSSETPKIQNQVKRIQSMIENPSSPFRVQMQNAITSATDWITGANGGYVVIRQNEEKQPYEILIMDTPDIATATKVWRWNMGGLGYSSHGYNGPYTTAITQDGAIVADFITAGVLTANIIKAGVLQSLNGKSSINMETGDCNMAGTFTAVSDWANGCSFVQGGTGFSIFNANQYIGGMALYTQGDTVFSMTRNQNFQVYKPEDDTILGGLWRNGEQCILDCDWVNAAEYISVDKGILLNGTLTVNGRGTAWKTVTIDGQQMEILTLN